MSEVEIEDTDRDVIEYDEDYSIMCHLPDEILCYIFAFLRLDDRKSVRLVSRLWYRLSTIWSITKNEKFVFRSSSHIEDIVKVMLKSDFALANLEFQDLPVISLPVKFWRECGPRIYSLGLFQCDGNDKMIKNIIIHCEKLNSFTYRIWDPINLGKEILRSSKVLDKLVEKGIQQTKLRTFDMFIINSTTNEVVVLDKIFLIYPGIRCFSAENISRNLFSYLPISLTSLTFLVHLNEFQQYQHYFEALNSANAKLGLRLKCFKMILSVDYTSDFVIEGLLKFFSSQEDLEVIHLDLVKWCEYPPTKKIMYHIFESCQNLRELSLTSFPRDYELAFNFEELPRFLTSISKLQFLQIAFDVFDRQNIGWPNASRTLTFPQSLLLTTLDMSGKYYKENDQIHAILLPRCPLLRHLKLCVGSDHTLYTIFKYLLKLQTLIITCIENCSYYGFSGDNASTGEGYSIKRLQQLKHFEICGLRKIESIEKILLEFQLPHLEFLDLDVGLETVTLEVWGQILSQIPELRELLLFSFEDYSAVHMETLVQFCKHLTKLRYLCIRDKLEEHDRNKFLHLIVDRIEEIFDACPSLRYLYIVQLLQSNGFSFHPFTKKILKVENTFKFRQNIFLEKDFPFSN